QTLAAQLLVQPLGEHESCLPIIEAVEHDEDAPAADAAEGAACHLRVLWNARQSKPQYIHGRRRLDWRNSRQLPHLGESSVGANGQWRAHFVPAVRPKVAHAPHHTLLVDQSLYMGMHYKAKGRILGRFRRDELQEARLSHQEYVGEASLQPGKVEGPERATRKLKRGTRDLGVAQLMERRCQTNLVENLHHRGMNRVAAKLPVKVFMHFEQRDRDSLARQKQGQHRPARSATHNAARSLLDVADFLSSLEVRDSSR